nr:4'-phosphopantetheinyl transferase superfamily protein [uncultured Devosia sp.]
MSAETGSPLSALQAMADLLMPPGVVAVCRDANGDIGGLFAEELAVIARAVPSRQSEFAAGRSAARAALRRLGRAATPIPSGPDRAPVWPRGFIGSISHCRTGVIAIAASLDAPLRHVGVDIEEATGLEPELWESICRPAEIGWFDARPDAELWAKIIFSIKEAVYKAQFPLTRRLIDFHDVEIVELDADGNFTASILVGELKKVTGRFRASDLFILAFAMADGPGR